MLALKQDTGLTVHDLTTRLHETPIENNLFLVPISLHITNEPALLYLKYL